jgi:DNA-binding Lrp family transcriptional regulator
MTKIIAHIYIMCKSESEYGFDRIAHRIAEFDWVTDVAVISGKSDLLVIYEAESFEDVSKFVTEILAPMENVRSTSTHFVMKSYKENRGATSVT